MSFEELEHGEQYTVISGANDTFVLGATVVLSEDGTELRTSNAGYINGRAQPGWIDVEELRPSDYAGVVFEQHIRDGWNTTKD